jgi:aerobic-type carbon monoxide dehydrogenase small subunit (CoxS/CutS family)
MSKSLENVRLTLNGQARSVVVDDPEMPLLYVLRDDFGLTNPRFGCGLAQCGSCTVLIDGEPVRSCVLPISSAEGKHIVTLAGLGTPEHPHPVQSAFVAEQAMQCGYCINGWIMTGASLVDREKNLSPQRIVDACSSLVCRCGSQVAMMRAIASAHAARHAEKQA